MILRLNDEHGRSAASAVIEEDGSYEVVADSFGILQHMLDTIADTNSFSSAEHAGIAVESAVRQISKTAGVYTVSVDAPFTLPSIPRRALP